jgi:hypothetical protein
VPAKNKYSPRRLGVRDLCTPVQILRLFPRILIGNFTPANVKLIRIIYKFHWPPHNNRVSSWQKNQVLQFKNITFVNYLSCYTQVHTLLTKSSALKGSNVSSWTHIHDRGKLKLLFLNTLDGNQPRAPTTSRSGKQPLLSTEYAAGWNSEPVWTQSEYSTATTETTVIHCAEGHSTDCVVLLQISVTFMLYMRT